MVCHLVVMGKTMRSLLFLTGKLTNDILSFLVFSILDVLDILLCYVYKIVDFLMEDEWKPCYCSSPKESIIKSGSILVSEKGEGEKIVCLTSTKLQLEEISDTLYSRTSLVAEVSKTTVKRRKVVPSVNVQPAFTVEMLQEKIGGHKSHPIPRWSDCDCDTCNSWSNSCKDTLYVHTEGLKG